MEQLCKGGYCKPKLGEYRELTTKLYDDIYGLESDLKERDEFLQKVVKARNSLEMEVSDLKKKNNALVEENIELLAENDQLDEDTDTGMELLRNANERERKVKRELEEYKKSDIENKDEISELEKEKTKNMIRFPER